jgi:hypothetical protein
MDVFLSEVKRKLFAGWTAAAAFATNDCMVAPASLAGADA